MAEKYASVLVVFDANGLVDEEGLKEVRNQVARFVSGYLGRFVYGWDATLSEHDVAFKQRLTRTPQRRGSNMTIQQVNEYLSSGANHDPNDCSGCVATLKRIKAGEYAEGDAEHTRVYCLCGAMYNGRGELLN